MRGPQAHRGFALALLLWMIAGMSLMVMAVIHAAHSDISMAELYVGEARARAAARGAALLAVRDKALLGTEISAAEEESTDERSKHLYIREYQFGDELAVAATVYPANAFTSLNDASHEELVGVLVAMGGMRDADAERGASAITDYRDVSSSESMRRVNFDGFRAREELLAIPGFGRAAYDKVKDFVHPYRAGVLDPTLAPSEIATFLTNVDADSNSRSKSAGNAQTAARGLVTFDAIWEQKRRESLGLGSADSVVPVETVVTLPSGSAVRMRIWLAAQGLSVLRAEAPVSQVQGDDA